QGASGSPVFKSLNNCVTGICNCGPPCSPGFVLPMSTIWPNILAATNAAGCTAVECAQGCPPSDHNCYETGGPRCTNLACCAQVCAADPFCCETAWDGICVGEALSMCGNCGNPNNGSCAVAHASPGCNDSTCCAAVCAIDPFCCDTQWDNISVAEANDICFACGGI